MKETLKAIQTFLTQNGQRPEATDNIDDRLVQALAELGRLAYSYQWSEGKDKINERWAQLVIVLLAGCVQQGVDIDKLVKERLAKLPTLPAPKQTRERVRGLRL